MQCSCAILSSMVCPTLPNFSALSHKGHDFPKKLLILTLLTWIIWWIPNNASRWQMGFNLAFKGLNININTKRVFSFSVQILTETFLILRRNGRDKIINMQLSSCKVPVIIVRFYWNLNFINLFSKNTQIANFAKISPVGAELFHADGPKDRHEETNIRFSQFCGLV